MGMLGEPVLHDHLAIRMMSEEVTSDSRLLEVMKSLLSSFPATHPLGDIHNTCNFSRYPFQTALAPRRPPGKWHVIAASFPFSYGTGCWTPVCITMAEAIPLCIFSFLPSHALPSPLFPWMRWPFYPSEEMLLLISLSKEWEYCSLQYCTMCVCGGAALSLSARQQGHGV